MRQGLAARTVAVMLSGVENPVNIWRRRQLEKLEKDEDLQKWLQSSGLKDLSGPELEAELRRRAGGVGEHVRARREWGRRGESGRRRGGR